MKFLRTFPCLVIAVVVSACVATPPGLDNRPLEFHAAVTTISRNLLAQFDAKTATPLAQINDVIRGVQQTVQSQRDVNAFVIDPFIDGDSANVTATSGAISEIISSEISGTGHQRHVLRLTSSNLQAARYVVTGATRYEQYPNTNQRLYHVYGAILDINSGDLIAAASSWISDNRLEDTPTPFYRNSPMYLLDAGQHNQLAVLTGPVRPGGGQRYIGSLAASAITSEGSEALEKADYTGAVQLFKASLQLQDGRTMKNYSGLYQSYLKLGRNVDASSAFYEMFTIAIDNNDVKLKILFAVDKTDFISDRTSQSQYEIWVQQIAKYMSTSKVCMNVVGHASHTGTVEYNRKLSLMRAQRVSDLLIGQSRGLRGKLTAIGRGFDENIVGTGTDNDQDALDRRVEFRPVACGAA